MTVGELLGKLRDVPIGCPVYVDYDDDGIYRSVELEDVEFDPKEGHFTIYG